ncbi:MAG: SDR family NAD(P)-dependent oxidoreductase, partial [Rikenellaceae bacterium]
MRKTIFVTGGATGIGAAAVRCFYEKGCNVAYLDIKEGDTPLGALFIKGDVRNPKEVSLAYKKTYDKFGAIDAIVANAGKHYSDSIFDLDYQEVLNTINLNVMGAVVTIHEALPYLNSEAASIVIV